MRCIARDQSIEQIMGFALLRRRLDPGKVREYVNPLNRKSTWNTYIDRSFSRFGFDAVLTWVQDQMNLYHTIPEKAQHFDCFKENYDNQKMHSGGVFKRKDKSIDNC